MNDANHAKHQRPSGVNGMPGWSVKIVADTASPILAAFKDKIKQQVEAELDVVGAEMEDISKGIVPVRSGYLQSTIYHHASAFDLEFGATASYASHVEFGTCRMGAQPYIRPALDASQQRILDAVLVGCMNALGV